MPGRPYLIFADIEEKLDVLHVECIKCARKGRYSVSIGAAVAALMLMGTAGAHARIFVEPRPH